MSAPSNKIIVAMCEGQHDVSFLSRILSVHGFTQENKKIGELEYPFKERFSTELERTSIPDKKFGFQPQGPKIPSVFFSKDNSYVFIHNLNGDGKAAERRELVQMYKDLSGPDDFSPNFSYRFLFFFDADQLGVATRMGEIRTEIGIEGGEPIPNGELVKFSGYEWGGYIFHDPHTQKGTLEDQLLSYFGNKIVSLRSNIESFLHVNALAPESTRKFISSNSGESYKGSSLYSEKKSILGIFAQLQFSGVSNALMINQTDFIKAIDISGCPQCGKIVSLFL